VVHPRKFVRDLASMVVSQYLARAMLLLRGLASAAALGPAGYGGWNALNLVLDYGSYASCGALQGLDLKLPATEQIGDAVRARRLLAGAWSIVVAGALLFGLALAVYLATGARAIAQGHGWGAPALMLLAAWLQLALQYQAATLRAQHRFDVLSRAQTLQALLGGGLGLALVWRFGIWGLLWGWIAGGTAALAFTRRAAPAVPLRPGELSEGLGLVRAGLPIFLFFVASLVLRSVDRMAFVRSARVEGLGCYSLGLMAAGLVLYLPESAAYVLYPRIAAASHGARDRALTWIEVARTHRALAVALPPAVGVAMVWAAPLIGWLLPAYRDGVPAVRLLGLGALMLSAATVPGYFLLGRERMGGLLAVGAGAALLNTALVFAVAARDPRPASIALASTVGYTAFAVGLVILAARELHERAAERLDFALASFLPALWAGALALAAAAVGPPESPAASLVRSVAVFVGYLPALWWFGRGVGLKRLASEWLAARAAAT
jgi:O-antigen/teichoic acid export membrane protein